MVCVAIVAQLKREPGRERIVVGKLARKALYFRDLRQGKFNATIDGNVHQLEKFAILGLRSERELQDLFSVEAESSHTAGCCN